jgi:hypothetical protein
MNETLKKKTRGQDLGISLHANTQSLTSKKAPNRTPPRDQHWPGVTIVGYDADSDTLTLTRFSGPL